MAGPTDCWVTFAAHDARAMLRFLVEAFGFREALVVPGEGDAVAHAELVTPGGRGGVMLGSARAGDERGVTLPGRVSAYVAVPDPDVLFARATAAGAEVVLAPYDTDHGSRDCALRDPEGGTWFFGTYEGAALP